MNKLEYTEAFKRHYRKHTKNNAAIKKQINNAIEKMAADLSYPSLRVKPLQAEKGKWEASVNMDYRIIFTREAGVIRLLSVGPHDWLP